VSEGFIPAIYEPIILAGLRKDSVLMDLWLEPYRQWDLIWSLGQRPCVQHTRGALEYGLDCGSCGAIV
jgi:hypothetical protein